MPNYAYSKYRLLNVNVGPFQCRPPLLVYLNQPAGGALKLHNGVEASLLLVDVEHVYRIADVVFHQTFVTP